VKDFQDAFDLSFGDQWGGNIRIKILPIIQKVCLDQGLSVRKRRDMNDTPLKSGLPGITFSDSQGWPARPGMPETASGSIFEGAKVLVQ